MRFNVYFPNDCLRAPSGIIMGRKSQDKNIFVVSIVNLPLTPRQLNGYLSEIYEQSEELNEEARPIGTWSTGDKQSSIEAANYGQSLCRLFGCKEWFCIVKNKDFDIHKIDLLANSGFASQAVTSLVFLYDQKHIWESISDLEGFTYERSSAKSHPHKVSAKPNKPVDDKTNIFTVIRQHKKNLLTFDAVVLAAEKDLRINHCCVDREVSVILFLLSIFGTWALNGISKLVLLLQYLFLSQIFRPLQILHKVLSYAASFTSTGSFIAERLTLLYKCLPKDVNKEKSEIVNFRKNLISSTIMDVLLGTCLVFLLHFYEIPQSRITNEALLPWVEYIGYKVDEIIQWLMGIPAGLKLNDPLNQFLGQFFLYHVRLWLEYLRLLLQYLPHLVTNCMYSACFGISVLLQLVSDVVSLLSFHVYVFYTYAGRLYNLQVSGLLSLWRLFLGKKWNPLRRRVDTLDEEYQSTDRLFIGTLLFTILLFLLPTTMLYYAIFALLRVSVIALQRTLDTCAYAMCNFPWHDFALRLRRSHLFMSTIHYQWMTQTPREGDQSTIVINMTFVPYSVSNVIKQGYKSYNRNSNNTSLKNILHSLISGELIRWTNS